ncbi:MAG: hypothetical protein IT353_12190 [Gemmatimonadaceae bacterium]|nr:hypothetical protein [Gemmatimonadaceae bacterium]
MASRSVVFVSLSVALASVSACERTARAASDTAAATAVAANSGATPASATVPPAPRRVPRPDSVRALYVNAWAAGSRARMAELIRIADQTEINAFIVDIKESDTYLTYDNTAIALAKEIGADQRPATKWLPALVDTLIAHQIYPIARIVVFKDRVLAEKKPELSIRRTSGEPWRDRKGVAWVNPYDKRVWEYNVAIAKEALTMGFSELQWDYVRFPDVTANARATMTYPGSNGKSRSDNIREFINYSKAELASFKVPITADVFGLVTHLEGDVDIGQNWEAVISSADAVLPMVYPSHYAPGLYGVARPIANPYQIVRLALTDAVERSNFVRDSTGKPVGEVMGWLEAMSIRGAQFGAHEVRLQIQAAYDAGVKSWALWNPGSKFAEFEDALRPAAGGMSKVEQRGLNVPPFTLSREKLSMVLRKRDQAAKLAAAAKAAGTAPPPSTAAEPNTPPSANDSGRQLKRR